MTEEDYIEIATKIVNDMINFKTDTKSFTEIYSICLNKYISNPTNEDSTKILVKVVKIITELGYDIDNIKPCRFKRFKY